MSDGGTTVAIVLAGVTGAVLAWIGVHFCRKWIKKRHVDIQREDYLKEMQAAQDEGRGRDRKRKRRSKERHADREPPEWQAPIPDARMPEDYMPQPQSPPQQPIDELPPQPTMPEPTMPEPIHVDYIVEADELPEVIAGLQGRRAQGRKCRSCSTESSSSSSSEEVTQRSRTSDTTREPPERPYDFSHRQFPRDGPPRMPQRNPPGSRYHAEGFEFDGMPQMPQGIRGGRTMRRPGRRYGTTSSRGQRHVLNQPDRMKRRLTPSNTPPSPKELSWGYPKIVSPTN